MSASRFVPLEDRRIEGGHDYELVSDLASDDYICLICTFLAREAQQATCCGKIFCRQCLEVSARVNLKCLHCFQDLRRNYFPDQRAIRDINQLKVYCKNKTGGCKWEGELYCAETHHDICPYRQVQCPNQCATAVRSGNLEWHLQTRCTNREVECHRCKQVGKNAYISTDHLEDCPNLQIDCPNQGCQEKRRRKNMGAHRQKCPKETLSCEYTGLGCEHVCLREDMAKHNESQMQYHLQLAMNELKTVRTLLESRTGAMQEHVIKMTNFSSLKDKGESWYSPSFYAFPGGYKMCLMVFAGGLGNGKGTHISAYLIVMQGENDENLEWPMRGIFSIELLNQERDKNHKPGSIRFEGATAKDYNSKVSKGRAACGLGKGKLFDHQDLQKGSLPPQTEYLKEDTLYFRVTMTKKISNSKAWLAGAIPS